MMKLMQRFSFFICAVVGMFVFPSLARAQATKEFGIDRSNLTRENDAVQEKTLRDIQALHVGSFVRGVFIKQAIDGFQKSRQIIQ